MLHSDKLVVVFGGTGFLGRYLVEKLAKAGYKVRVPSRDPKRGEPLKVCGHIGQVALASCDVQDAHSVDENVKGADVVINLIGMLYEKQPGDFHAQHVDVAERIAKAAKNLGVKQLIHISILGADKSSSSFCLKTKGEGEEKVLSVFPEAVIVKPSLMFGHEDRFFNRFAKIAEFSPFLPLIGGGETKFQPVYVDDVAEGVKVIIDDTSIKGAVIEMGGPKVYTFKELMHFVLCETWRCRLLLYIPWELAKFAAWFLEKLPTPLLTSDLVEMLKYDSVVSSNARKLEDFGIERKPLEMVVPLYLSKYRKNGNHKHETSSNNTNNYRSIESHRDGTKTS